MTGDGRIIHSLDKGYMYKGGHVGACNVGLKDVADYDVQIWHAFYDMDDSHDDINVLQRCVCLHDLQMTKLRTVTM